MKIINKFSIILTYVIAASFSTTLLSGNELLEKYRAKLKQQATYLEQVKQQTAAKDKQIALILRETASALKNFEKNFNKSADLHNPWPILDDKLPPLFAMFGLDQLIKPTSIFGTVALTAMLNNQIDSHQDPEFITTRDLINSLKENKNLRDELTEWINKLNQVATPVFSKKIPLETWILYNKGIPSALYSSFARLSKYVSGGSLLMFLGNLSGEALKDGFSYTLPALSSIGQYIPPVNISETILETGLSYGSMGLSYGLSWHPTLSSVSLALFIGLTIYGWQQPQQDPSLIHSKINDVMRPFVTSLQDFSKFLQEKNSTPAITKLAESLIIPEKIDATADHAQKIINCLKKIAHLDACLALATAAAEGKITQINIANTPRITNMTQQNLEKNLNDLYSIGCESTINKPWHFNDGGFFMDQAAIPNGNLFLRNLQLSHSIGFVMSPTEITEKLITVTLLDISKVVVSTQKNYTKNKNTETIQQCFVAPCKQKDS